MQRRQKHMRVMNSNRRNRLEVSRISLAISKYLWKGKKMNKLEWLENKVYKIITCGKQIFYPQPGGSMACRHSMLTSKQE